MHVFRIRGRVEEIEAGLAVEELELERVVVVAELDAARLQLFADLRHRRRHGAPVVGGLPALVAQKRHGDERRVERFGERHGGVEIRFHSFEAGVAAGNALAAGVELLAKRRGFEAAVDAREFDAGVADLGDAIERSQEVRRRGVADSVQLQCNGEIRHEGSFTRRERGSGADVQVSSLPLR